MPSVIIIGSRWNIHCEVRMMFTHATLRYFSGQDYDDEVYSGLPKKAVLVDDEDPINIPLELVARVLHDFHKELC